MLLGVVFQIFHKAQNLERPIMFTEVNQDRSNSYLILAHHAFFDVSQLIKIYSAFFHLP